jgi:hypothetical protein
LASGGFKVKGWISNHVLTEDNWNQDGSSSNGMTLLTNETAEKVLGLV